VTGFQVASVHSMLDRSPTVWLLPRIERVFECNGYPLRYAKKRTTVPSGKPYAFLRGEATTSTRPSFSKGTMTLRFQ
jgi:hypothetical protein